MIIYPTQKTQEYLETTSEFLKELGADYVGYLLCSEKKQTAFFNHPKWTEFYINKGIKADPYTNYALNAKNNFFLWKHIPVQTKLGRDIIEKRKEICDVKSGLTFYNKIGKTEHIFALATTENNDISDLIRRPKVFKKLLQIKSIMTKEHLKDHEIEEESYYFRIDR